MAVVKGSEGVTIRFDTDLDLSTASTVGVLWEKPSGATASSAGTVSTATGSYALDNEADSSTESFEASQWFSITAATGLFDEVGSYKCQAKVTNASDPKLLFSPIIRVRVEDTL